MQERSRNGGSLKTLAASHRITGSSIQDRPKTVVDAGDHSHDRELTELMAVVGLGWRGARGRYLEEQRAGVPKWRVWYLPPKTGVLFLFLPGIPAEDGRCT